MSINERKRSEISAFIVCMNEENKIRRALESVKWCDEIVVIDSGSTDKTIEICRTYTDKIFIRPWPGYVAQKRFALEQCTKEWVLNLDADEEVSEELKDEILTILKNDDLSINGYQLSRVVFFLGKWWRRGGWYPEFRLRLCRRITTSWGGRDPHEKASVTGKVKRLEGELHHYTYSDISHQIRTLNSYSYQAARSLFEQGERASALKLVTRPIMRFIKWYFLKRGFLEGFPGFIVAILESYYVFQKYAKLWEFERSEKRDQ
jgi:glycosyltransferase involved in cell wall biosynthesis